MTALSLACLAAVPPAVAGTTADTVDATTCAASATISAVDAKGSLWTSSLTGLNSTPSTLSPPVKQEVTGLGHYFRFLGFPDDLFLALSAEPGRAGLATWWRPKTSGTGGIVGTRISDLFSGHALNASTRNTITVDEAGNLFEVDSGGVLRHWRFNDVRAPGLTVSGRPLASGWDRYDLIVATGKGVIWAREGDRLHRFQFDPSTYRATEETPLQTWGWAKARTISSLGGDTLLSVDAATGAVTLWRFANGRWAVRQQVAASGWNANVDVWGRTDSCRLATTQQQPLTLPAAGSAPVAVATGWDATATFVVQRRGSFQVTDWWLDTGADQSRSILARNATADRPALVRYPGSRLSLFGNSVSGEVSRFLRAPSSWSWEGQEYGGRFPLTPTVVTTESGSTGATALALDADGQLWTAETARTATQAGSTALLPELTSWHTLSGPPGVTLTGRVAAAPRRYSTTTLTLVVADTTGILWTARYAPGSGRSPNWSSLGTGVVGDVALGLSSDDRLRIVGRTADGTVVTTTTGEAGDTFATSWQRVGITPADSVGVPAVQYDPELKRFVVFTRGRQGGLWAAEEQCGAYSWRQIAPNDAGLVADPAAFLLPRPPKNPAGGVEGTQWGVVSYDKDLTLNVLYREQPSSAPGSCQSPSPSSTAAASKAPSAGVTRVTIATAKR